MYREDERFLAEASIALAADGGDWMLKTLIGACVRQPLERPGLARLLDIEQARPALRKEDDGPGVLGILLLRILTDPGLPLQPAPALADFDLPAILRAMTDAAGERGETPADWLQQRVEAAGFGHLKRIHEAVRQ